MTDTGIDTCHLGLMSFASLTPLVSNMIGLLPNETAGNPEGYRSAVGATRWSEIRFGVTWLINDCVIGEKLGGFKIVSSGMIRTIQSSFLISEDLND